ncbi:MAG: hypothetical protein ACOZCL_13515 [Bacillota bacterium]
MRSNSLAKVIIVTFLGLLGLWLIYSLMFGTGYGFRMNYGGGHMYFNAGYGFGATAAVWILLLVKVLFAVFVISLVVGLIVWAKNNLFTAEDIHTIKNTFNINDNKAKENCSVCGKELNPEWNVCPHCGKDKTIPS